MMILTQIPSFSTITSYLTLRMNMNYIFFKVKTLITQKKVEMKGIY